jgi:hypothetical protein
VSLLDRVRSAAAGPRSAPAHAGRAAGFDYVEVPSPGADLPSQRLSKREFEAMSLQERVGLLVQGNLRFYRGDQEVPPSDAMRAAY